MGEFPIVRSYTYRHSFLALAILTFLPGCVAVLGSSVWFATKNTTPRFTIYVLEVRGVAATILIWVCLSCAATLFVYFGRLFWNRVTNPLQRIAFTDEGIYLHEANGGQQKKCLSSMETSMSWRWRGLWLTMGASITLTSEGQFT